MHGGTLTDGDERFSTVAGGPKTTRAALVVVASEVVRRGIVDLLRSLPEVTEVTECAQVGEVAAALHQRRPRLVIVAAAELSWLNGHDGVLRERQATVLALVDPVWVEHLPSDPPVVVGAYLWQPSLTAASLRAVVSHCGAAEIPMPPELVQQLLSRAGGSGGGRCPGPANLTRREREVLKLLVRGLSNKQIAKRLSISSHGAKRLVASIMLKLDAPNRTLAAVTAVRAGIVHDE